MSNATGCVGARTADPCVRCDVLLGLDGGHVEQVERDPTSMIVTISTPWQLMGCPTCGVVAVGRGRRVRRLHDAPGVVPVVIRWRQRTWRCPDPGCPVGVFVEQHPQLVRPRGSLTCRAVTWAIGQLRREHATLEGLARQLGTTWKTLWRAVRPRLVDLAGDESRLTGVSTLGVDEHVWHHTPHKAASKGPSVQEVPPACGTTPRTRPRPRADEADRNGRPDPGPRREGPRPAAGPGPWTFTGTTTQVALRASGGGYGAPVRRMSE